MSLALFCLFGGGGERKGAIKGPGVCACKERPKEFLAVPSRPVRSLCVCSVGVSEFDPLKVIQF